MSGSICVKVTRSTALFDRDRTALPNLVATVFGLTPSCTTATRIGTSTVPGPPAGPVMMRPSMPTLMVIMPAIDVAFARGADDGALVAYVERVGRGLARLAADHQGGGADAHLHFGAIDIVGGDRGGGAVGRRLAGGLR